MRRRAVHSLYSTWECEARYHLSLKKVSDVEDEDEEEDGGRQRVSVPARQAPLLCAWQETGSVMGRCVVDRISCRAGSQHVAKSPPPVHTERPPPPVPQPPPPPSPTPPGTHHEADWYEAHAILGNTQQAIHAASTSNAKADAAIDSTTASGAAAAAMAAVAEDTVLRQVVPFLLLFLAVSALGLGLRLYIISSKAAPQTHIRSSGGRVEKKGKYAAVEEVEYGA